MVALQIVDSVLVVSCLAFVPRASVVGLSFDWLNFALVPVFFHFYCPVPQSVFVHQSFFLPQSVFVHQSAHPLSPWLSLLLSC